MTAEAAFCPWCGAQVAGGGPFCPQCGKPLRDRPNGKKDRPSLGRIIATVVIVLVAAFLVGAILPFENGNLLAYGVGAIIAATYVVAASRR